MTVTVHIGAHKTASTHLQNSLKRNAALLTGAGIRYLGPKALRSDAIQLCAGANKAPSDPGDKRAAIWAGAQQLFLSEENILGTAHHPEMMKTAAFYPRGPQRLNHIFRRAGIDEADILLSIRDPASFFVSAYSQRLFSGDAIPFEDFLMGCDVTTLRWSALIKRLAMVPQVRSITVWRFEDYVAVRRDVLASALGSKLADRIVWRDGVVHPGLSARAHALIFQRIGQGVAPSEGGHARDAREVFPKLGDEPGYQPWTPAQCAASTAGYLADLDRIEALTKTTLLRKSATA